VSKACIRGQGTAPRGLLLDFGAVISVSLFERHRDTEAALGLPRNSLGWLGPLAPETDALWQAMQRDEISEREYWARRARELGEAVGELGWDMLAMLTRLRHTDPNAVVRPAMTRLIRQARARGIRVSILSNELELFYGKEFLSRMDVLRDIESIIDATHTKILKPDPRAYALAIDAMQLRPQEILFVDDQLRNIAGAVKAGLRVHYFDLRDVPGQVAAIEAHFAPLDKGN
jgi:haloacid dehalogenase superfamily, subfamily IA, variant 3 with third motif having DD or ED